jgi:hypothetical protein
MSQKNRNMGVGVLQLFTDPNTHTYFLQAMPLMSKITAYNCKNSFWYIQEKLKYWVTIYSENLDMSNQDL